ncbi:hypothetical protein [Thermoactinospora rubra]|nr:hypothetical protein [Thermoactinospora rubra]
MTRQIAIQYQAPTTADLEARVRSLEIKVAHLSETVETLVRTIQQRS